MKKIILILVILFCSVKLFSGSSTLGIGDAKIVIQGGSMRVYGSDIDSLWSVKSFTGGLGPAVTNRGNVFKYDSLGLCYYTPYNDTSNHEVVALFAINFQQHPINIRNNRPDHPHYDGFVTIEGYNIDKNTSLASLKNWLPQYNFSSTINVSYYHGKYMGIHIEVVYDDTETLLTEMVIRRVK